MTSEKTDRILCIDKWLKNAKLNLTGKSNSYHPKLDFATIVLTKFFEELDDDEDVNKFTAFVYIFEEKVFLLNFLKDLRNEKSASNIKRLECLPKTKSLATFLNKPTSEKFCLKIVTKMRNEAMEEIERLKKENIY